jgi:hypothetical protein
MLGAGTWLQQHMRACQLLRGCRQAGAWHRRGMRCPGHRWWAGGCCGCSNSGWNGGLMGGLLPQLPRAVLTLHGGSASR